MTPNPKVSEAWKPLPGQPKEKLGTVHPTLVEALDNLLHRSLNIPSKVRVVGQVLVAIDCRPTLAKNNCWGQDGLSCARYSLCLELLICAGPSLFQGSSCVLALLKGRGRHP